MEYNSSVAVDRGGSLEDPNYQDISSTEWTKLNAAHVLWDFNSDYDSNDSIFTVPTESCLYRFDIGSLFENCSNVKKVMIAIFKKSQTEAPDDLWFVVGSEFVDDNSCLITASSLFDMTLGEQFYLAAKLVPTDDQQPVSAQLSGDDDFTAWGWDFHKYIPQQEQV